jgi:hypothetical protein
MTFQKKQEIANYLQNNNFAYTNGNGDIYVLSEEQLDVVDCILSDWGIEFAFEITNKWGEWEAYIEMK